MFTKRFVLFGLVLFSTRVSESHLTKCCPPGEIFSGYFAIECVSVPRNATELYVHWNTTMGLFQGIPQCDEPEDFMIMPLGDLDPNNFLEVPACLEIFYEQDSGESIVIVIHCRSHKDRQMKAINASIPQLAYIRKCCPRDTVFDSRTKSCISLLNETKSLAFLLNELADADLVTVATEGPPTCKGPIVDYEIDENDIFLRNRTYSVMVPVNKSIVKEELSVTEDNVCLEVTSDSAPDRTLTARVCRDPEYCDRNACIRKCCAENEFLYFHHSKLSCNKLTAPNEITEFHEVFAKAMNQTKSSAFDMTKDYGVLIGKPCKYAIYFTGPRKDKWLTSEGHVFFEHYVYDHNKYCMDVFYNESEFNYSFHLFICFDPKILVRFQMNTALQIISCAFLLITLLVYLCQLDQRNLYGKTVMCHVSSLFMAFICLLITTSMPGGATEERYTCKTLAYTALFSKLSAFSWLNVMCFDIWWTFGVLRRNTFTKVREHRKRFLLYCLYAWGLSFMVSILAIIADSTDILPDYLQPKIGEERCWFTESRYSYSEVTFFIGPVMILLISNMVFFILTLIHCNKIKAEIKRVTDPMDSRNKRFHSDRKRLMNVNLFIIMGIFWIWDIVSFFLLKYLHDKHLEWFPVFFYISAGFNCLEGVLIFSFFIVKNRIYQALRKRLRLDTKKKKSDVQ